MNEKQRKYTVLEIEKYKEDIEKATIEITAKVIKTTILSCFFVSVAVTMRIFEEMEFSVESFIQTIISLLSFGIPIISLKNLISAIARKAGLEVNLNRLEYDLEMSKLNEEPLNQQKTR